MSERDGRAGGQDRVEKGRDEQSHSSEEAAAQDAGVAEVQERKAELDADVDALLDSIDEILEENAEEFVRGYVQKGGE